MTFGEIDKQSIIGFLYEENQIKHIFVLVGHHTFYEVLSDGQYSLYARRRLFYSLNGIKLYRVDSYFLVREKRFLYFVKLKRKSLLNAYPESVRNEIKVLLKKNRIKIRKEADLISAVEISNRI
jgi:hypothetical protein